MAPITVDMADGTQYKIGKLLGGAKSNAKTAKSDAFGEYLTYSLSLAPAHASGFNVCASASAACIQACLYTSGYAAVNPRTILPARIAKTRLLRLDPEGFAGKFYRELELAQKQATRQGKKLAVRLNVYSDIIWEKELPEVFTRFPSVQFYDYTKHYKRMQRFLNAGLPENYHLTFSWSGRNANECREVLANGGNIAVPFHVSYHAGSGRYNPLPSGFLGYPVIDGDKHDLRFLDPKGSVVGLRVKGRGKKDHSSGFVVSIDNPLVTP